MKIFIKITCLNRFLNNICFIIINNNQNIIFLKFIDRYRVSYCYFKLFFKKTYNENKKKIYIYMQTWVKYFLEVFRINTRILTKNSISNMYLNTL
jgi:hypothetical protein